MQILFIFKRWHLKNSISLHVFIGFLIYNDRKADIFEVRFFGDSIDRTLKLKKCGCDRKKLVPRFDYCFVSKQKTNLRKSCRSSGEQASKFSRLQSASVQC